MAVQHYHTSSIYIVPLIFNLNKEMKVILIRGEVKFSKQLNLKKAINKSLLAIKEFVFNLDLDKNTSKRSRECGRALCSFRNGDTARTNAVLFIDNTCLPTCRLHYCSLFSQPLDAAGYFSLYLYL